MKEKNTSDVKQLKAYQFCTVYTNRRKMPHDVQICDL